MNPRQKVLFTQLQVAGMGIIISIMGGIVNRKPLIFIGICVLVFGIVRFFMMRKMVNLDDLPDEDSLQNGSSDYNEDQM